MGVITPFSEELNEKKPPRKSTHPYVIEPGYWPGARGKYIRILCASYPDMWRSSNDCDKCGEFSDYFVEVYSNDIDGYNYTMTEGARMCNYCIMTVWFEVLFNMRVPNKDD